MSLGLLIRAMQAQGLEVTLDDLRDILWLSTCIGDAHPGVVAKASGAQTVGTTPPPVIAPTPPAPPPRMASRMPTGTGDSEEPPSLYGAAGDGGTLAARRVQVRGQPALPQGLAIARALRPLSRRRPGPQWELDERATAERIADTGLRQPVWRRARERWFDIVLVIEDVPSLGAWQPVVDAFVGLLQRQGGFRSVSRLLLSPHGGAMQARKPNGSPVRIAALPEREQRRLVLVLSDGTSAAWHDGTMGLWLQQAAARLPVAVAQFLPPALWPNTAVGFAELRVASHQLAMPTARLRVARPGWAVGEPGQVVPVLALEPGAVASWARMVASAGEAWSTAALLPLPDDTAPRPLQAQPPTPTSTQRLAAFRSSANADAQRLAAYFSVVRPLTPPVMRVIHMAMAPASGAVALAQVFLGGLLHRRRAGATPDEAAYDFHPGLRERLQGGLTRQEFVQVNLALHDFLQQQSGTAFDFFALIEDREGGERLPDAALPFVQMARSAAARFGGAPARAQPGTPRSEFVAEIEISASGHTLSFTHRGPHGQSTLRHELPLQDAVVLAQSLGERDDHEGLDKLGRMAMPTGLLDGIAFVDGPPWAELLLDMTTALFPWELLFRSERPDQVPLALRCGMTRRPPTLHEEQPSGKDRRAGALVIGQPAVPSATFPPIPGAAREAGRASEAMGRVLGPDRVKLLVDADHETVSRAVRDLSGLRVLHLATHAEVLPLSEGSTTEPSEASRIRIVLGGDLRLGLADFVAAGSVPEFVYLGAVRTAALAPPLLGLGARVVVAVAGNVDDEQAAVFAEIFYTVLETGQTLLEATHQARAACFQRFPDSDAWGRFQVWGDPAWRLVDDEPAATPAPSERAAETLESQPSAADPDEGAPVRRRLALCVGIDTYPTAPLAGCVNDARLWQQTLQGLGFEVKTLFNDEARQVPLLAAMRQLLGDARAGDEIVFQFAGHGTQAPDVDGDEAGGDTPGLDEALCPHDFDAGLLVIDDEIGAMINAMAKGVQLTFFMDCCYSGSNARTTSARGTRPRGLTLTRAQQRAYVAWRKAQPGSRSRPVPREDSDPAEVIFAACQSRELAWESEGHGEFTLRATRLLREGGAAMTPDEFYRRVLEAFGAARRQTPQLSAPPERLARRLFLG